MNNVLNEINKSSILSFNNQQKEELDNESLKDLVGAKFINLQFYNLNTNQKLILKEYINSVDNITKLRDFYNITAKNLKKEIINLNKKTSDPIIKIKLNEVVKMLKFISKTNNVKNDDVVNLLQYCELINELKEVK